MNERRDIIVSNTLTGIGKGEVAGYLCHAYCHKGSITQEEHQFDGITPSEQKRVWGMFGIHDTRVNCEDTFLQHYHHVIHFDGEHRLDDTTINEVLIPLIRQVAKATK